MAYEGKYAVYSGLDDSALTPAESHMHLDTEDDERCVRINSRDFSKTTETLMACQAKPNATGKGTQDMVGFESSPRFADEAYGRDLIGFKSNPDLKGTGAAGDLSGAMRAYEGKLESASGSTRTVAVAAVLHAMQALHGTVTDGPWVIKADAGGGNVAWAGFASFPDDGQLANDGDDQSGGTVGWIKVKIGAKTGYIQVEKLT